MPKKENSMARAMRAVTAYQAALAAQKALDREDYKAVRKAIATIVERLGGYTVPMR